MWTPQAWIRRLPEPSTTGVSRAMQSIGLGPVPWWGPVPWPNLAQSRKICEKHTRFKKANMAASCLTLQDSTPGCTAHTLHKSRFCFMFRKGILMALRASHTLVFHRVGGRLWYAPSPLISHSWERKPPPPPTPQLHHCFEPWKF